MSAAAIVHSVAEAFAPPAVGQPFRHWILSDILPEAVIGPLAALAVPGEPLGESGGRRETHNALRAFVTAAEPLDPAGAALVEAFQSPQLVGLLARTCGTNLDGTYLRIEYCRDVDGFWLEPHTDIAAKRFTLLVYLNDPPAGEAWGTDLYDASGRLLGTAPSRTNAGLAFVPGADTWHGFARRRISGTRRSLIVNYVDPAWRSHHELAHPGHVVRVD